jgi:hypothetical protein
MDVGLILVVANGLTAGLIYVVAGVIWKNS